MTSNTQLNFSLMQIAVCVLSGFSVADDAAQGRSPFLLWNDESQLPKSAEIPLLDGVQFSVIKPHEPAVDGGNWLLGVALAWHNGNLYASYGFNTSADENTATEEARGRISTDDGKTWGTEFIIDAADGDLGVSHGVFLSHGDKLWAFQGAFYNNFQRTHTRAYVLDDATGQWLSNGIVINNGFWPMQEPRQMADGNWIMSGVRIAKGYRVSGDHPVVAISHGSDFTKWDLVVIAPAADLGRIWGESTVIFDGNRILNIARWGKQTRALVSTSDDFGRTWTDAAPSNLSMNSSKPYTGTLSSGQHYLIGATTADCGHRRNILTIAVTRPGETKFSKVSVIRRAVFPDGPGTSNPDARLSYPYAIQHGGKLYVGYADKNEPSAELAVIPIANLVAE